jgi:hypothetical protein
MAAIVFQHDGNAVFEGVWTAITAAKSFDATLLDVPRNATHWVRYTTGATAALVVGETVHGATSSATARLTAKATEVGTAGTSDTGILFLDSLTGTWAAETVHAAVSNGTVVIAQAPIKLERQNPNPKTLLISVETASIHVSLGGTLVTATAGTNHGITLTAGQSWVIRGKQNIRNFQCINEVNANGAVLKYTLYY